MLGECLLISCLPDNVLRALVVSRGKLAISTRVLVAEPGKFDIKRREPGILYIRLQVGSNYRL